MRFWDSSAVVPLLIREVSAWTCVDDLAHADRRARRLLALHDLRTADALQLAAALVVCDEQASLLPFVTLDRRLADVARREGFTVLPSAQP